MLSYIIRGSGFGIDPLARSRSLHEHLIVAQVIKTWLITRSFIIMLTRSRCWISSWAISIQSPPWSYVYEYVGPILILYHYLTNTLHFRILPLMAVDGKEFEVLLLMCNTWKRLNGSSEIAKQHWLHKVLMARLGNLCIFSVEWFTITKFAQLFPA